MECGDKLYHLIKHADLCFMGALGSFKVAGLGRANGAHKRRQLGSDLLRLERRLAQSITATCPGCSAVSSLAHLPR